MRKIGFFFYCIPLLLLCAEEVLSGFCVTELGRFDQQLEKMEGRHALLRAKVFRLEEQADRWQFRQDFYQDARRAWQQADVYKEAADEMEQEIVVLKEAQKEFYKEHPECQIKPEI